MGKAWDLGVRTPEDLIEAVNSGQLGYGELSSDGKKMYDTAIRTLKKQPKNASPSGTTSKDSLLNALSTSQEPSFIERSEAWRTAKSNLEKGLGVGGMAEGVASSASKNLLKGLGTQTPSSMADFKQMDEASSYADPYKKATGRLGTLKQSLQLGNVMKDINAIYAERVKRNDPYYGIDDLARLEREAGRYSEAYKPVDVEKLNLKNTPDYIASNLAVSLPMTGELMAKGLAGGLAGKLLMGAGIAGTAGTLGTAAPVTAPLTMAGVGVTAGTVAYTAQKEAEMEAAGVYETAIGEGKDHATAVKMAQDAYNKNIGLLLGTNAAEQAIAFGLPVSEAGTVAKAVAKTQGRINKLSKSMDATKKGRLLKGIGVVSGKTAAGAGVEGGQELAQFGVQESALGHDIDWTSPEAKESAVSGGMMGGIFTGGGLVLSNLTKLMGERDAKNTAANIKARTITELPDAVMPEVEAKVQENIANGMPPAAAVDAVLDEIVVVPEIKDVVTRITQEEAAKATEKIAAEVLTKNKAAEVTDNTIYDKNGNALQIVDRPNPEFYVVQNQDGQRMMVPVDEVTAQHPSIATEQTETQPSLPHGEALQAEAMQTPVQEDNVQPQSTQNEQGQIIPKTQAPTLETVENVTPEQKNTSTDKAVPGKKPTPDRKLKIQRGKHGAVDVVFPDSVHADLFAFNGRMKRHIEGGKQFDVANEIKRLALSLGYPEDGLNLGDIPGKYKQAIMDAIKELPAGQTFTAPSLKEVVLSKSRADELTTKPVPEAEAEKSIEVKNSDAVYNDKGEKLTVTNAGNESTVRVEDKDGSQQVVNKDEVKTENPEAKARRTTGKTATAKTERGTSIDVQYAVVDADSLIASHSTELKTNAEYPQELQPRDRGRMASEAQITRIANYLEPEFLGESPKVSEGAPIIGSDMVVESGNGRVIAIKRVYERGNENSAKYQQWLADNADKFGLKKEDLAGIKNPVLVRIRQGEIDRPSFVKEANEQSVAAMSATEQGKADAERITPGMMSVFSPSEDGQIINKGNQFFIREFMGKVVGPNEQGRYATSDGSISQEGVTRIRNAIFAKAYENAETLEKLAESTDNNVKNVTNAMLIAAPKMAMIRAGIEAGELYPLDITDEIAAATNKLSQLREQGVEVARYLDIEKGDNLFGEKELSPLSKDILDVFDKYKRSSKSIAKVLNDYADGVAAVGSPKQGGLWGESSPPTKAEVLDASLSRMEGRDGQEQTSLFGDETVRSEENRKVNEGTGRQKGQKPKTAKADLRFKLDRSLEETRIRNRWLADPIGTNKNSPSSNIATMALKKLANQHPNLGYTTASKKERQGWYDEWAIPQEWLDGMFKPGVSGDTRSDLQSGRKRRFKTGGISENKGNLAKREQMKIAPVFYSQLQRVIEAKMPNKAIPNQILAIIKGGQVKQEEIKWSGIEDWLKEQDGKVSKQDVLDFIDALTKEQVGIRMYVDGLKQKVVAEKLSVSPSTVRYWLLKNEIPIRPYYPKQPRIPPKTTQEVKDRIIEMYNEGARYRDIMPELGVSSNTINSALREAGIDSRGSHPEGYGQALKEEAVRLYVENEMSTFEVAERLGISAPVVTRAVKSAGVTRTPSERMALRNQKRGYVTEKGISVPWQSKKTGEWNFADSGYELVRMSQLDDDPEVLYWTKKTERVPYGDGRIYVPDLYIEYANGRKVVEEVKALWKIDSEDVTIKAEAAKKHFNPKGIKYRIVTQDDIGMDNIKNFDYKSIPMLNAEQKEALIRESRNKRAKERYANKKQKIEEVNSLNLPITEAMKKSVLHEGQPKFKADTILKMVSDEIGEKLEMAPEAMQREDMQAANILAKLMTGNDIIPFRGEQGEGVQGIALGEDLFINEKTRSPLLYVTKHEMIHSLGTSDPEALDQLMQLAKEYALNDPRIKRLVNNYYRKKGYELEEVWEEFTADVVSEVMEDSKFWTKVREKSPSLIKVLVDILDQIIAKFRKAVTKKESMLKYIQDMEGFRDAVAGVVAKNLQSKRRNIFDLREASAFAAKLKVNKQGETNSIKMDEILIGTKIKDKSGKPLAVYHGSMAVFDQFDEGKLGSNTGSSSAKEGFFFTDNPKLADFYGQSQIDPDLKAFSKRVEKMTDEEAQRLLDRNDDLKEAFFDASDADHGYELDNVTGEDIRKWLIDSGIETEANTADGALGNDFLDGIKEMRQYFKNANLSTDGIQYTKGTVKQVFLSMKKPYIHDYRGRDAFDDQGYSDIIKKAKQMGHDGVIIKNTRDPLATNLYIVFSKDQIVQPQTTPNGTQNKGGSSAGKSNLLAGVGAPKKQEVKLKRDESDSPGIDLPSQEVQAEFEASNGVSQTTMRENIAAGWDEIKRRGSRTFEWLPSGARFAKLKNALLLFSKQRNIAARKTINILDDITKPLSEAEYGVFRYKVVFDDLAAGIDAQEITDDMQLPFKLTKDNFAKNKEYVDEQANAMPNVMEAIEKRRQAWEGIKAEYIAVQKAVGHKVDKKLTRKDYYRHQILEYARDKGALFGTGKKLRTPTNRGFLRRREGSDKNFNTDYLQAEFEVMSQMIFDIEPSKIVKLVMDNYDVMEELKKTAAQQNDEGMLKFFQDMIDEHGIDSTPDKLYRKTLNKKQAIAFSQLYKMAAKGELPIGPDGKYEKVVQEMADTYYKNISKTEAMFGSEQEFRGELFAYLNYLSGQAESEQGQIKARTVFKGIAEKQRMMKNTLGKGYATWENLIPEGYVEWQPQEGHMFFTASSIPEGIANLLAEDILASAQITGDMLRQVMAVGQEYPSLVVPEEVALTLNDLYHRQHQDGLVYKAYRKAYVGWKQWQLISPRRFFKYNARNMTGDLDAVLAGNPKGMKKVPEAWKDLKQAFFSKDKVMSSELYEWFQRGGFDTLMQTQEISDINYNREFARIMESRTKKEFSDKNIGSKAWHKTKAGWLKYWDSVRVTTDFREAFLRYAMYLDYLEQMQKNDGNPYNWGASNRDEIMTLDDVRDRAAKLANELLGAYDEVSMVGTTLADNFLPFWRWQEVNFVRYKQLIKNACQDGYLMGSIAGKVAGMTIRSPFIAWKLGKFVFKASLLMAMITAWNLLRYPDEEKDLPADVRERVHIVLGRDKNGKVVYFSRLGAMQDFLDWFGIDTPVQTVRDFLNGRKSLKEIAIGVAKEDANKMINSLTPFIKTTGELLYGYKLFPDAFKKQRIRDRWQYMFESFGLGNEYKALAGKPTRGYGQSLWDLFIYKADPYESAYWGTLDEKRRFLKKIGKGSEGGYSITPRSEALYNIKLAARYGDKEAGKKYLLEYIAKGGTAKGLKQSLNTMNPLYGLSDAEKRVFVQQLDTEGKEDCVKALEYYARVISGKAGD